MDMIKNRANQKKKWKITIPISLIILSLCLNLAAWFSSSFCNYYVMHIFPVWVETYGRLTGMFSFSVGEIMLYHASPINERYPIGDGSPEKYGVSEVTVLRDYVVNRQICLPPLNFSVSSILWGTIFLSPWKQITMPSCAKSICLLPCVMNYPI